MTKKHFEEAARIVREGYLQDADPKVQTYGHVVAIAYARLFEQFNPRFDRARFYKAAGLGD
jgi:hypothetical protein